MLKCFLLLWGGMGRAGKVSALGGQAWLGISCPVGPPTHGLPLGSIPGTRASTRSPAHLYELE